MTEELYNAHNLRDGLKLIKAGLKPSRGWSRTKALLMCYRYTGHRYKRNQIDQAIADLNRWIAERRDE